MDLERTTFARRFVPVSREYRDGTVRAVHSVVGIMADGYVPGAIVSWIARASLAVLKRKDRNHRPEGLAGHSDQRHDTLLPPVAVGVRDRKRL